MFAALLGMVGLTLSSFVFLDRDDDDNDDGSDDQVAAKDSDDIDGSLLMEIGGDGPVTAADVVERASGVSEASAASGSATADIPTSAVLEDLTDDAGSDLLIVDGDLLIEEEVVPGGEWAGTEWADVMVGGNGDDVLAGGAGDDDMWGLLGDNTMYGDDGDDTLSGSEGDDTLYGGNGNDGIMGGWGNDVLYGGSGEDLLQGGGGDDVLYGDDDDETDFLNGGEGDDVIHAGAHDAVNSGNGQDLIVTDTDNAIEIFDHDETRDTLEIMYAGETPALKTSTENGATLLFADDTLVATLHGVTQFDVGLVRLVPDLRAG